MNLSSTLAAHGQLHHNYPLHTGRPPAPYILVTPRAILVLDTQPARATAAALDLADFHAGCRGVPVLPIVVTATARPFTLPLPFAGVAPVQESTAALLPGLVQEIAVRYPPAPIDVAGWANAPYRPVPGLMAAAAALYARHDVLALAAGSAGPDGVRRTRQAIAAAVQAALQAGHKQLVFVTGAPGAGKTVCGLDVSFTPGLGAAFLTGNPTLVHVLRAALVRDAVARGLGARAAAQRVQAVIQALPAFRDRCLTHTPAERVLVIDEAQRCWTGPYAVAKTHANPRPLTQSEPLHIMDAMARHDGAAVIVCLLGGGQEIHGGEGGLAAWGEALDDRPAWQALAPPDALDHPDPRQRLASHPRITLDPALALRHPIRALRRPNEGAWVAAVLAHYATAACTLAQRHGAPRITRSLDALRRALRQAGPSRGLVASAGARRLRAEGLGAVLRHQDADEAARWFLDSWPDIRSAAALEVVATEFGVQGLELDHVGVCWDADLISDGAGWQARQFRGHAWTTLHRADAQSNRRNAYRVLLTRARRSTILFIPRGCPLDPTRAPALYDATARFLTACGCMTLDEADAMPNTPPMTIPALL